MVTPPPPFVEVLVSSLREAEASCLAHVEQDGTDQDCPQWYARRMVRIIGDRHEYEDLLAALLEASRARGVYERGRLGHYGAEWPRSYAEHVADTLSGARSRLAAQLDAFGDF